MVGRAHFVAISALEQRADKPLPTLCRRDPHSYLPGRVVAHMLAMPTRQVGDPHPLILMKADDPLLQGLPTLVGLACSAQLQHQLFGLDPRLHGVGEGEDGGEEEQAA